MSQIRRIRRRLDNRKQTPGSGKKWITVMIIFASVFVLVMAVMGFRNLSRAPTPDEAGQSLSNPPLSLLTSEKQQVDPSELVKESDTGAIFLFVLGAG